MEEQKHKLLDNDYQKLQYERDDSLSSLEASSFTLPASDKHQMTRRRSTILILYAISGLIFAAFFYLLGLYSPAIVSDPYLSKTFGSGHCGNSSEEALKNGCVFDFIPGAWVHPDCYDEELEREFMEHGDWHWYADPEGNEELSEEVMRRTGGPNPTYVSLEYHDSHCAFTWRKLHRAILLGKPIDSQVGEYPHTTHCSHTLSRARDGQKYPQWKAPSRFFSIFTHCELPQKCK